MSDALFRRLVIVGVIAVVVLVAFFLMVDIVNIEGYEVGVVHKWYGGVQTEPLYNGMHVVWFGKVHKIDVGFQKISFAPQVKDDIEGEDTADNDFASIEVACGAEGGQKATIILTCVYSLDKSLAVQLYKDGLSTDYRYKIMKRTIIDVVNRLARPREALEIYSGTGFNDLAEAINKEVKEHEVLVNRGIVVKNCTIYQIRLDPAYETEIQKKQLARQEKLTAQAQTDAWVEKVKKEKIEQQVMVAKRTAEGEAKKVEVVKAAEADMEQQRLEGEGMKLMKIAQAEGELALGMAEAKVEEQKKLAMYDGEAGRRRATVEVAVALADKLKGLLSGVQVIPEKAFVALMRDGQIPLVLTDEGVSAVTPKK